MLHIYNTATRRQEIFKPLRSNTVRMYVCGMTVYDYCHIGHARVMVVFDTIARCLRLLGYDVEYARNITDIDDKIMQRAQQNNENYARLSERFIAAMHKDCNELGLSDVSHEPRATEYMEEIIAMIQTLIEKGYAYCSEDGDVYYSVERFADYGKLSGQNVNALIAGARVAPGEHKKHPADFALWKGVNNKADVGWQAPWSYGRPGWHIECSAMSKACLGKTLDIHGGGPDLVFPHHENEIAQSEAANGCALASIWMHAGAVRARGGDNMSKSKGNFVRLRDALNIYHPETLRYYLILAHYRSAIEYDDKMLRAADTALERLYRALLDCPVHAEPLNRDEHYTRRFINCIEDDFNTPEALAVLFDIARTINSSSNASERTRLASILRTLAASLGLLKDTSKQFLQRVARINTSVLDDVKIEAMIAERNIARKNKDYTHGDEIRMALEREGVFLEDCNQVTTWHRKTIP